ncbi:2621_t:CDS:2, partial [Racocetra persica]
WILQEVENGQRAEDLKMNVLQAIHFIIQGWDEVKANTIQNFRQTTNPVLNDIANILNALDLLDPMQVEEYLAIPEENIVYEVPSNDQVITELVETFRTNEPTNIDLEDEDDSFEAPIVSANMAIASLETMRTFLLQQDCIEEYVNLVRRIEKFIKKTK